MVRVGLIGLGKMGISHLAIIKAHPKAKLHLAGNKMPKDLLALELPGLHVNGRVSDADMYMSKRHVMVVPLFSAGGMRVKIIEGMAMGKCVISTPIGAEGISCTDGEDILLARTATEMTDRIVSIIEEPERARVIGFKARELIHKHYATERIVGDLVAFFRDLRKT